MKTNPDIVLILREMLAGLQLDKSNNKSINRGFRTDVKTL